MGDIILWGAIAALGAWCYRIGKRRGSIKGFNVGRRRGWRERTTSRR